VLVFLAALLCAYAALIVGSLLLGLLVTEVLVPIDAIGDADESAISSLAAERTAFLTDAARVGAQTGGGIVLPIVVALIGIVGAALRHWRIAAFAVLGLLVESSTYAVTSALVPRQRPDVRRLEDLPVDASFPSGHTAAAFAVYVGLALVLSFAIRSAWLRASAWGLALVLVAFVAMSRMYQGMHHPLDVAGGVAVGIGAIAVMLFACRAAEAASRVGVRGSDTRSASSAPMQAAS
jgi:undecaprenyl-diphosphatase